jgi:hypothetical protein
MLKSILIGTGLLVLTVGIHAVGSNFWIEFVMRRYADRDGTWRGRDTLPILMGTAMMLLLLHFVEVMVWALTYLSLPADANFDSFEQAVYFSLVTFTTLGYGDITLGPEWRVLSGLEAMNGILLFGWTTALLFVVVQRNWRVRHHGGGG